MTAQSPMTRRRFLLLTSAAGAGLAGAALLAACAPKAEPTATPVPQQPAAQPTKPPAPAQPAAKEPVTIQLHLRAGGEKSEVPIYVTRPQEFMQEHPEIKVELAPIPGGEYQAKIQTMAAAKTLGDVMWTSDVWTDHTRYVKLGIIAVVDDWLEANGHTKDEWLPACVDTLTHDGKMYGLPKCSHPGDAYIWINEDMFVENGLPVPETYGNKPEQLMEWAIKLTKGPKGDREVYGYYPHFGHIMAFYNPLRGAFGGLELNDEGTKSLADSDEWYEWMKWTTYFYVENIAPKGEAVPSGGREAMFAAGKLAMHGNQRYMNRRVKLAMQEAGNPFKWKAIQVPKCDKPVGWTACVDTHSVTTFSKHPNEAHMLEYALADQRFTYLVARDIGYLGGRVDDGETVKDLIKDDPFLALQYQCMIEERKFNQPANARGREVETVLKNELDKVWLGEVELTKDFMKQLKAKIDEVLAKPF
ncbi:MAG: extracellular solute-binding protein [Chloroflexi bacterium]|nr:extracellular solute-binding protein [Chloroflexota bacterium]